jgi:hypothetical protein
MGAIASAQFCTVNKYVSFWIKLNQSFCGTSPCDSGAERPQDGRQYCKFEISKIHFVIIMEQTRNSDASIVKLGWFAFR